MHVKSSKDKDMFILVVALFHEMSTAKSRLSDEATKRHTFGMQDGCHQFDQK
jgi:hypothetical protein